MNQDTQVANLLKELVDWTKIGFYSQVKAMLDATLNDEKKRQIYVLADGSRGSEEIRKIVQVSPNKVSGCFKSWEKIGLIETLPTGNRLHKFDPELFGLDTQTSGKGED